MDERGAYEEKRKVIKAEWVILLNALDKLD